jgi:mannitol/fructose-specific phosphotransferase system IIA component (Ntr-type)
MTTPLNLAPEAILADLVGTDAVEVFHELCAPLARTERVPLEALVSALVEREQLASTAVGHGVAIPHGVHPDLGRVAAAFGRSRAGLDFAAPDGQPVHLFVVLVRPPDAASSHLKALARWGQILSNESTRQALLAAQTADDMRRILDAAK